MFVRCNSTDIYCDYRRSGSRERLVRCWSGNDLCWFLVFGRLFRHLPLDVWFKYVDLSNQLCQWTIFSFVSLLWQVGRLSRFSNSSQYPKFGIRHYSHRLHCSVQRRSVSMLRHSMWSTVMGVHWKWNMPKPNLWRCEILLYAKNTWKSAHPQSSIGFCHTDADQQRRFHLGHDRSSHLSASKEIDATQNARTYSPTHSIDRTNEWRESVWTW